MRESLRLRQLKLRSADDAKEKKVKAKAKKKLRSKVRRGSYAEKLQQAGIPLPPIIWIVVVSAISVFLGVTTTKSVGPLVGGTVTICIALFLLTTYLTARAEKRRSKVVPQLPGFIDTLAASLSTGYSMETSVEHAAAALPEGVLKREFRSVVRMLSKGLTLDEALDHITTKIAGQEVVSVCITIRLFYGLGGRVVSPFKRLGGKMREQQAVIERANRDLSGPKNGFYVILALAVIVPAILSVVSPEYMQKAFEHEVIKYVIQGAMMVQLVCLLIFKRMTTLRV